MFLYILHVLMLNHPFRKSLIDEDQRDLRAFKERYLEDGDLYSEGGRRSRNFKWHGLDDSQLDLFGKKVLWGEEEVVDNELLSQAELERRKMKHEKDQFLQEQVKDTYSTLENVHLLRVGRTYDMHFIAK